MEIAFLCNYRGDCIAIRKVESGGFGYSWILTSRKDNYITATPPPAWNGGSGSGGGGGQ